MSDSMHDEHNWAAKVDRLHVDDANRHVAFNLEGKRLAGPQQGFGRLYDRTFTIALGPDVTPETLIADWRTHFGELWPKTATFYGSGPIEAGAVAPLTASGVTTGVLVIYADETSFSYYCPEGHMFAGMITFSAVTDAAAGTVAEIRMLVRPADPLWVLVWPLGKRMEGRFWQATLRNLAARHGAAGAQPHEVTRVVDGRFILKNWKNVGHNGAIATVWHTVRTRRRSKQAVAP